MRKSCKFCGVEEKDGKICQDCYKAKKSVEYNEKTDMIRMKKKDYDTLMRD
jgi:hypothetical protein